VTFFHVPLHPSHLTLHFCLFGLWGFL
jgi:hypothetical protein